jgi:hypothetical protein
MTSNIRNVWWALGLTAVAALALAGAMAPGRASTQAESSIMTMKQDLADRECHRQLLRSCGVPATDPGRLA